MVIVTQLAVVAVTQRSAKWLTVAVSINRNIKFGDIAGLLGAERGLVGSGWLEVWGVYWAIS